LAKGVKSPAPDRLATPPPHATPIASTAQIAGPTNRRNPITGTYAANELDTTNISPPPAPTA
jgi:hypothetical protein